MTLSDPAAILAFDGSQIDGSWYTSVTDFARDTSWLNGAMDAYTSYGIGLFVLLILAGWWMARRADAATMTAALAVPVAAVVAYVVNDVIKAVVAESPPVLRLPPRLPPRALPTGQRLQPFPPTTRWSPPQWLPPCS